MRNSRRKLTAEMERFCRSVTLRCLIRKDDRKSVTLSNRRTSYDHRSVTLSCRHYIAVRFRLQSFGNSKSGESTTECSLEKRGYHVFGIVAARTKYTVGMRFEYIIRLMQ